MQNELSTVAVPAADEHWIRLAEHVFEHMAEAGFIADADARLLRTKY